MSGSTDDSTEDGDYVLVEAASKIPPHLPSTPRSMGRVFVVRQGDELVFDYFNRVPTLHLRRRPRFPAADAAAATDAAAAAAVVLSDDEAPPPQPTGAPFQTRYLHYGRDMGRALFWARPEEAGLVPREVTWRGYAAVPWFVRGALVDGLMAPRCFTFCPDMVVLYRPPEEDRGERGSLIVAARGLMFRLSPPSFEDYGNLRPVVSALTPHTVIL